MCLRGHNPRFGGANPSTVTKVFFILQMVCLGDTGDFVAQSWLGFVWDSFGPRLGNELGRLTFLTGYQKLENS